MDNQRAEFEAWAKQAGWPHHAVNADGSYFCSSASWEPWQAATQRQQERIAELEAQVQALSLDAGRYRAINTPEIADFLAAVHNEALHQRERWGSDHDEGKTDADWFWLLGYLGGKAMHAQTAEKRLHHIITTAAACLNWHAARVGAWASMRPGIDPAAHGIDAAIAAGKGEG